jgi:hypothetical protein
MSREILTIFCRLIYEEVNENEKTLPYPDIRVLRLITLRIKVESTSKKSHLFRNKEDVSLGSNARWLTLVSPQDPNGTELVLEPDNNHVLEGVIIRLKKARCDNKIPFTAFAVNDIHAEYKRLKDLRVKFIQKPIQMEPVILAVFDNTCGNLIQIFQTT